MFRLIETEALGAIHVDPVERIMHICRHMFSEGGYMQYRV